MSRFDDELSAVFAAAPLPPADEAFTAAVTARTRRRDRVRMAALYAGFAACAVAGAAVIEVCALLARPLVPAAWLKPSVFAAAIAAPTHMANAHALLLTLPILFGAGLAAAGVAAAAMTYLRPRA
jgi:hypothetical protein